MYGLDWNIFVEERTPGAERKVKRVAWVHALLAPAKTLHGVFLLFRAAQDRHIAITPQVCIMRHWLNQLYDTAERRFVIEDYANTVPVRIWGEAYNTPLYLPTFLSSREYDFLVIAPCEARVHDVEIHAFLRSYKLAGKAYKLVYRTDAGGPCPDVGIPLLEDE